MVAGGDRGKGTGSGGVVVERGWGMMGWVAETVHLATASSRIPSRPDVHAWPQFR